MHIIYRLINNYERSLGLGCRPRAMRGMASVFCSLPHKLGYSKLFLFFSHRVFIVLIFCPAICVACEQHDDGSRDASNYPDVRDARTLLDDPAACASINPQIGTPCTSNLKCFKYRLECQPFCEEGCTFMGYNREDSEFYGYIEIYAVCQNGVWRSETVGGCAGEEDVICECQDSGDDADSGSQ